VPEVVFVKMLDIVTSVKLTIAMFSVVCVNRELKSMLPLDIVLISIVEVKLPLNDETPTSVPEPILELVPRALISAVAICTTPPTFAKAASAKEELPNITRHP
jgi:hypothetical protein